MPDASTSTMFVSVLGPLSRLDAPTILEKLDTDLLLHTLDKLELKDVLVVSSATKELNKLASHRLGPVRRLRGLYSFTPAKLLEGTAVVGTGNTFLVSAHLRARWPLGLDVALLGEALTRGAMPALQFLLLGGYAINDAGITAFGQAVANGAMASLRHLDLNSNNINADGIKAFCKPPALSQPARTLATPPARSTGTPTIVLPLLEVFHLAGNPIGDEGALGLAMAVGRGAFPKMKKLSVGDKVLPVGEEAIATLQTALPHATVEQMPVVGNERDLELVMSQAGVPRPQAAIALKENDGDVVNAIMQLTM